MRQKAKRIRLDKFHCEVPNEKPRLTWPKLTQYLTPEEGKPRLRELLEGVKALMKTSVDWHDFMYRLDLVYPRLGDTLQLPFREDLPRLDKPG